MPSALRRWCLGPPLPVALLLTVGAAPAAAQTASVVEPGPTYPAGTSLTAPLAGLAVTVPAGFVGEWDGELGALGLGSAEVIGAVWGWSEGEIEEAAEEVGARLERAGLRLMPRGQPTELSDGARGVFDALSAQGAGVVVAVVRRGPAGNVAVVAGLAAPEAEARAEAFVDEVAGSLRWSTPDAAEWRAQVEGAVLRWTSSGSDMSSGTTTATGASQAEATLAFCGGGYRYAESSESYVSIDGVSASNSSSDAHQGAWTLVADLIGTPTLVLEAFDGRSFAWTVEESGDGYLIDGYLYHPSGGC